MHGFSSAGVCVCVHMLAHVYVGEYVGVHVCILYVENNLNDISQVLFALFL